MGNVRLYEERGRGEGGGQTETGTTSIEKGPRASTILPSIKARYTCRRVEELKTIAGSAVSYALPPTPEPSNTRLTGRRGENFHMRGRWTGNQEYGIGRQSAGGL